MVSYLPVPRTIGEMKTRPTQHAVRELNSYGVQLNFEKDGLSDLILELLHTKPKKENGTLKEWSAFVEKIRSAKDEVSIAIVGKYFDTGDFVLSDAYLSVIEAIKFSAANLGVKPVIS